MKLLLLCNVVISLFQQIDLENTFTAGRKFKCWDFRTPGLGINWALPTLWTRQEIENRTVESPPDCYVDFMAVRPIYNQWKYKGNPQTQRNIIGMWKKQSSLNGSLLLCRWQTVWSKCALMGTCVSSFLLTTTTTTSHQLTPTHLSDQCHGNNIANTPVPKYSMDPIMSLEYIKGNVPSSNCPIKY